MANHKVKIAVFGTVVVIAVVLIIGLVVHRSLYRDRLCKESGALYYEDPITNLGSCEYQAGMQGPCGKNMVLALDKRNSSRGVGTCQCDVNHFTRTMIYHEETKQCYFIFTQAYCEEGMWLNVLKNKGPICDTRICDPDPDTGNELVPLADGRCVELAKYDNVTCNKSQVIQFHPKKIYPSCQQGLGISTGSVGVPETNCPEGYFSTDLGHCQPDFDFD